MKKLFAGACVALAASAGAPSLASAAYPPGPYTATQSTPTCDLSSLNTNPNKVNATMSIAFSGPTTGAPIKVTGSPVGGVQKSLVLYQGTLTSTTQTVTINSMSSTWSGVGSVTAEIGGQSFELQACPIPSVAGPTDSGSGTNKSGTNQSGNNTTNKTLPKTGLKLNAAVFASALLASGALMTGLARRREDVSEETTLS